MEQIKEGIHNIYGSQEKVSSVFGTWYYGIKTSLLTNMHTFKKAITIGADQTAADVQAALCLCCLHTTKQSFFSRHFLGKIRE